MFIDRSFLVVVVAATLMSVAQHCFCLNLKSLNSSDNDFTPGIAAWYGSPTSFGSGTDCGFGNDVTSPTYNGMVSAGNMNIFKSGMACGICYQVKCNKHPSCSGIPLTLTITDACHGICNKDVYHFDMSGKAFSLLAKPGQENALIKAKKIDIEFKRVQCNHKSNIVLKIDVASNRSYLAFAAEYVNGFGDLSAVQIWPVNPPGMRSMKRSLGATWEVDIPEGLQGPYSLQMVSGDSRASVIATDAIPVDWAPGKHYDSGVNLPSL